jgi:hypothetical protein
MKHQKLKMKLYWPKGWQKSLLHTKYYWNDQIKEDEMGKACNVNGGDEKCIQNFGCKA